ncbi:MAG TPA: TatD family hydrolase [Candidatus Saccharimonadales bacterium]|nr:TatD family hydrolase [Candidatus Saccharimonadales bacterium]
MEFVDTHCHIHFPDYELDPEEVITSATEAGVMRLICVGCTLPDSKLAVKMAAQHDNIWASIGLHPHEGSEYVHDDIALQQFHDLASKPKVVAIGETGLDYYYNHSTKEDQQKLLRFQLDMAVEHDLPVIFHLRGAKDDENQVYDDFFALYGQYKGLRGVIHSFSTNRRVLDKILEYGLYVGLNGIMTFSKNADQLAAAKAIPLEKLLLETDAPFLTPAPHRGKICEPKYVGVTAEFLAKLRGESLANLAAATTANAQGLFKLTEAK